MIFDSKNRTIYEVTLPNKKVVAIWFKGKQLEEILKQYDIPYKKVKKVK